MGKAIWIMWKRYKGYRYDNQVCYKRVDYIVQGGELNERENKY
ncbi:hypothetical protein [Clostridium estertheticum]|nr:hypothetical protein [Clostridium estertheticum]